MYRFSLSNFRGFKSTGYVDIRPITILIGENSAGKSSFLAAIKYFLDFSAGNTEASFNKDPFQLGTFQQIAHYRGGKAGRAKEFRIQVAREVTVPNRLRVNGEKNKLNNVEVSIKFSSITVTVHLIDRWVSRQ